MAVKSFKFISPGIFINEIDNSQLPALPGPIGPAIIGRFERGPALKPVQVQSFSDFVNLFGNPIAGGGQGRGDIFRHGNYTSPTYAAYAVQAWMRNNSPVTVVRLLGQTNREAVLGDGYAGWSVAETVGSSVEAPSNNGAYGLFICQSSSAHTYITSSLGFGPNTRDQAVTGTLAAIWYLTAGSIELSGATMQHETSGGATIYTSSVNTFVQAADSGPTFKVSIKNGSGTEVVNSSFNFDPDSSRFIRKVFNTSPIRTNAEITPDGETLSYWLGESFEGNVRTLEHDGQVGYNLDPSKVHGVILRLGDAAGTTYDGGDFRMSKTKSPTQQFSKTGWFFSQDMSTNYEDFDPSAQQKLFRLCSRELGEETQRKIKLSIKDLRAADPLDSNQYGTFTVLVRDIADTDANPNILEQYNNCNLNPASENYIARRIGNKFLQWDDIDRRYRTFGDYNNVSNYIYVEVNTTVDGGNANPKYLPFGVYGPPRYTGWGVSGSVTDPTGSTEFWAVSGAVLTSFDYSSSTDFFVEKSADDPNGVPKYGTLWLSGSGDMPNAHFKFPQLRLRKSSSDGPLVPDPKDAYFGVDTSYNGSRGLDYSVFDVIKTKVQDLDSWDAVSGVTEYSWYFTLDNVRNADITAWNDSGSYGVNAVYEDGSRNDGTSYTAHTASGLLSGSSEIRGPITGSYLNVISDDNGGTTAGWDSFTTLLHGGSDGLNVKESDPFRNSQWDASTTNQTNAAFNSLNVAIDCLRDPEVVEYNLLAAPGITNNSINNKLVDMCELRGDALAVIDLDGGFTPPHENTQTRVQRKGSVITTISNKKNSLQVNSSYGCAYYPWVQIRDTINGATLWAPPSIVALGAMSYGQANSQLWFAPAGFTRGGLSVNRAGGIPVVGVEEKLTVKQRDKLYEAQINPIASFPAEGIVIFGQKTLQVSQSALDRINVRRLVIFLKKQISRFAATVLFDQNVDVTWTRFKSKVVPFLQDVKSGLGITEFKVLLDETTTTADLIDRNIMYAKIFIKPARAIEFIAIDFVISNTGASFED